MGLAENLEPSQWTRSQFVKWLTSKKAAPKGFVSDVDHDDTAIAELMAHLGSGTTHFRGDSRVTRVRNPTGL